MRATLAFAAAVLALHAHAQDSVQRFVSGSGINLRGEPSPQGSVIGRLALNERVTLIAKPEGSAFCEVLRKTPDGAEQRGFTACTYLSLAATNVNRLSGRHLADGKPNPDYDPKRLFWLSPSWPAPLSNLLAPLDQEHVEAAAAAMRSIALPSASPSWFKDGRDIARLDDTTAGLSGRFGIVHTYRTQPRALVCGDNDGRVDLVAWEAVGHGPGHLGGPTTTDDPWHRLFFVNIAGRWHVLGHDVFSYGCGC